MRRRSAATCIRRDTCLFQYSSSPWCCSRPRCGADSDATGAREQTIGRDKRRSHAPTKSRRYRGKLHCTCPRRSNYWHARGARASTNKATMRAYGQLSTTHAPNRGQARTSRCSSHAMLNDAHRGPVAGVPQGRLQFHDPALEPLLSRNAFAAREPTVVVVPRVVANRLGDPSQCIEFPSGSGNFSNPGPLLASLLDKDGMTRAEVARVHLCWSSLAHPYYPSGCSSLFMRTALYTYDLILIR